MSANIQHRAEDGVMVEVEANPGMYSSAPFSTVRFHSGTEAYTLTGDHQALAEWWDTMAADVSAQLHRIATAERRVAEEVAS